MITSLIPPIPNNGSIVRIISVTDDTNGVDVTSSALFILNDNGTVEFNAAHPDVISSAIRTNQYTMTYEYSKAVDLARNTLKRNDMHYLGDDIEINIAKPVGMNITVTVSLRDGADPSIERSTIEDIIRSVYFASHGFFDTSSIPGKFTDVSVGDIKSDDVTEDVAGAGLGSVITSSVLIDALRNLPSISNVNSVDLARTDQLASRFGVVAFSKNEYPVESAINVVITND